MTKEVEERHVTMDELKAGTKLTAGHEVTLYVGGVAPGPAPEPAPDPGPDPSPGPSPDPAPAPAPGPSPGPTPEPGPTPAPEPTPEPTPDPTPEPTPEPTPPEPGPGPTPPAPAPGPAPAPPPPAPTPEPAPPQPKPEPKPTYALGAFAGVQANVARTFVEELDLQWTPDYWTLTESSEGKWGDVLKKIRKPGTKVKEVFFTVNAEQSGKFIYTKPDAKKSADARAANKPVSKNWPPAGTVVLNRAQTLKELLKDHFAGEITVKYVVDDRKKIPAAHVTEHADLFITNADIIKTHCPGISLNKYMDNGKYKPGGKNENGARVVLFKLGENEGTAGLQIDTKKTVPVKKSVDGQQKETFACKIVLAAGTKPTDLGGGKIVVTSEEAQKSGIDVTLDDGAGHKFPAHIDEQGRLALKDG